MRQKRKKTDTGAAWWMLLGALWATMCLAVGARMALQAPENIETASAEEANFIAISEKSENSSSKLYLSAAYLSFSAARFPRSKDPTILIYHTHTTEAYFPTMDDSYVPSAPWRTKENTKNVCAVGERLKKILEEEYGYTVLHDTTDHEPPALSTSYERSEQTIYSYLAKFPSIRILIDLHRDAYGEEPEAPTDTVRLNGTDSARLMLVVGKGDSFEETPYYKVNMDFASKITNHLTEIHPGLARPVRVKAGRYNQHIVPYSILIEAGHNANTLQQTLAAMPYLAESIAYAIAGTENGISSWLPTADKN